MTLGSSATVDEREERDVGDDERDHRAELDDPVRGAAARPQTGKRLATNITSGVSSAHAYVKMSSAGHELRERDRVADESAIEVALDRIEQAMMVATPNSTSVKPIWRSRIDRSGRPRAVRPKNAVLAGLRERLGWPVMRDRPSGRGSRSQRRQEIRFRSWRRLTSIGGWPASGGATGPQSLLPDRLGGGFVPAVDPLDTQMRAKCSPTL